MRILVLTLVALVAFAANSLLNRGALLAGGMDPAGFTAVRLASGAGMLALLVAMQGGGTGLRRAGSWPSAAALTLYAVAFSYAYVTLDAGAGALILFASVQLSMFGGSVLRGQRPHLRRWAGSALGLAGLAVLFLPGAGAPHPGGALLMVAAGCGWGVYSLRGATSRAPLVTTAGNFLRSLPVAAVLLVVALTHAGPMPGQGLVLAVASGALASGLGYAVWYSVLPRLDSSVAALAQLTVPLIALAGGAVLLGEAPGWQVLPASALILGGVGLGTAPAAWFRRRAG